MTERVNTTLLLGAKITAHVRQAHNQQHMFSSSAPYTRKQAHSTGPHRATLAENLWGSKEDLLQITQFINTTKLDVSRESWNAEDEEGAKASTCRSLARS